MNFSLRNSIGVRLLRVVFGCYLVITIIVTAVQLYFEYANVEKGVVTELYNVGRSFEDGIGAALWTLDNEAINSILQGVQKIEAVAGVKVTDQSDQWEGGSGIMSEEGVDVTLGYRLRSGSIVANEVTVKGDGVEGVYYQYKLDIVYEEYKENKPELIGFVYIYAGRDTVINRFKNSLFLILINAVIKTSALWIIFLYFSRKFLSHPLSDLTEATSELSRGEMRGDDLSIRLEQMAQSPNKNELQELAQSFIVMRRSIIDKIDNLNRLNQFAVALTQAGTHDKIFERTFDQLSSVFGVEGAIVFDKTDNVSWSSASNDSEGDENVKQKLLPQKLHDFSMDVIRGRNEITYANLSALDKRASRAALGDMSLPVLYVPVQFGTNDKREMWLIGDLNDDRLQDDGSLNAESHSFLQVIRNMVSATLTSISQRQIIEDQNHHLEQRVLDRTKELASANKELRYMAVHDPLTQLPNRTLFHDRLSHIIEVAERENRKFAVASIDLTEFKQINDNYGHDAGDTVLIEVGRRFSHVLRRSDTLARMGGDEFAAILAGDNIEASLDIILSRIQESLVQSIHLEDGDSILASANVGVAVFPDHATDADLLFKYADIAMYQAKRSGAGYAIFDQERNSQEREYLQFMYELEHAIERNQLRLHYQPIVDLKADKPVSFEALLRWEHHERGMIPPGEFIPHAERTSIIKPITYWVIEEACRQCSLWHKHGIEAAISVNVSARIFTSPDLAEKLQKAVAKFGLEPRWLKLEITESAAMADPERALDIISVFNDLGFTISIDDFGTGHSSLSYLTRLPIDEIKIDRSFLANDDETSQIVVQTVIELAHTLDFYVVAEGIETPGMLDMLHEKGCDSVQGYYISRPVDANTIELWYRECEKRGSFLKK